MNFLEQLAAEWYQYKGFFVRTNVKFGRRSRGGWKGEMDVVAYNPNTQEFLHIETSTDADSNKRREERFGRKFTDARQHYRDSELFPFKGEKLKQIAIVGFTNSRTPLNFGGDVKIISIPEFIREITNELKIKNPAQSAIPETYPRLRAIQYAMFYTNRNS